MRTNASKNFFIYQLSFFLNLLTTFIDNMVFNIYATVRLCWIINLPPNFTPQNFPVIRRSRHQVKGVFARRKSVDILSDPPNEENCNTIQEGSRTLCSRYGASLSSPFPGSHYVISLTVLFGVLTAPTMGIIVFDTLRPTATLNPIAVNVCLMFPFIYCCVCPFVLIKCLSGVKMSISALILFLCSPCH